MPKKGTKTKKDSYRAPAKRNYSKAVSLDRYKGQSPAKIFPMIKPVLFTFAENLVGTVPAGGVIANSYRANSLWDPRLAAGGGQPRYFDTFLGDTNTTAPYRRYTVTNCRCIATVINQSNSHLYAALSIYSNQANSPSSLDEARTRPDTIVRIIPPIGSSSAVTKLVMARDIGKVLGVKDLLDNPDMKSDFNSNPLAQANCVVTIFNPYSPVIESYALNVEIQYDSRLFVRNDVADS